jgi:DNA adenine methylase
MIQSFASLPGSKARLCEWISNHIPPDHSKRTYNEPFLGTGSVFFYLSSSFKEYHLNDLNSRLINLFKTVRSSAGELQALLELTPYSLDEFKLSLETSDEPLEDARRFFVNMRQSFSGIGVSFARANVLGWSSRGYHNAIRELPAFGSILNKAVIDCMDFEKFIDRWGREDAFIYCDPPYTLDTRVKGLYKHEMTTTDQERFLTCILRAASKGAKVMVSGYPNPLYADRLNSWRTASRCTQVAMTIAKDTNRDVYKDETLWMNY